MLIPFNSLNAKAKFGGVPLLIYFEILINS